MDWFKKHTDTVIILGAFAAAMLWMNGQFNALDRRLIRIETVMIMKDIMPRELANKDKG